MNKIYDNYEIPSPSSQLINNAGTPQSEKSNNSQRFMNTPVKICANEIDWNSLNTADQNYGCLNVKPNMSMIDSHRFQREYSTGGTYGLMDNTSQSDNGITPDLVEGVLNNESRITGTRRQFLRTKLCPFIIKGRCTNTKFCYYAHSMEQLRPLPDLRQTKLCDEAKKGHLCTNPSCTYAHAAYELKQPTPDLVTYKTTLCFFWRKGKCFNGTKCRFAHGIHELRDNNIGPKFSPPGNRDKILTQLGNNSVLSKSVGGSNVTAELFKTAVEESLRFIPENVDPSNFLGVDELQANNPHCDLTEFLWNLNSANCQQMTGEIETLQQKLTSKLLLSAIANNCSSIYHSDCSVTPSTFASHPPLNAAPILSTLCSPSLLSSEIYQSNSQHTEATNNAMTPKRIIKFDSLV